MLRPIRYLWLLLFCYTVQGVAASSHAKNIELTQVASQIQQLQKKILIDRQHQETLQQELQTIEVTIGQLSQEAHRFNIEIAKEQMKLNQLHLTQKIGQNRLTEQQAALDLQIRAAYQLSQLHPLKIILNQDNPNTIQRHLTYYRHLNQSRSDLIASIKLSLSSLNSNMAEIVTHQANLKKLLRQKQTQQLEEQHAQNHRHQLIHTFKQSVDSKEQQLTTLVANQKALSEIISQLQVKTESPTLSLPFNQQHGKLHWPVTGNIIAHYGSAMDVAEQRLNGVLIQAKQDTPVRAIYAGKVIFANWLRGFGLLIIIHHDNNFMSLYGRNHSVLARAGSHVNTGDVIATTGNSGGFDKTSLYFEIRQNGIPVNPNIWCH